MLAGGRAAPRRADASPWDGTQRAAVRLIAGAQRDGVHHAGLEIRLAPGWKTYWRYPGDSGIPPRFDFSNSRNVKSVTVRWPAPQRLTDEGGTSIGYKHDVVFPLDVVAQDAGKAGDAGARHRLRGVRETVRAGGRQGRADAHRQGGRARAEDRAGARRWCRALPRSAAARSRSMR